MKRAFALMANVLMTTLALPMLAADVTGHWSGTMQFPNADGDSSSFPVYFVLTQHGNVVTGTGGPQASDQFPISNGKVDGVKVTFDIPRGKPLTFLLTLAGDKLKGDVKKKESPSGTVEVQRERGK
jgi:hypothetical protein